MVLSGRLHFVTMAVAIIIRLTGLIMIQIVFENYPPWLMQWNQFQTSKYILQIIK